MQKVTLKPTKTKRVRNTHARYYDSPGELVKTTSAETNPYLREQFGKVPGAYICDWDWIGREFKSPAETATAVNELNAEMKKLFSDCREKLSKKLPSPTEIKRVKTWDETDGDDFDNDRFRSGQQPWRRARRQSKTTERSITIAYVLMAASSVNTRDIVWGPATAIVLADLLEDAGYSVKLIATSYVKNAYLNDEDSLCVVTMKKAGDPVDMTTIANCATGWFFRIHNFADMREGEKQSNSKTDTPGYGFVVNSATSRCELNEIDLEHDANCKYYEMPMIHDRETALQYAKMILAKIEADQQN
jgi:hypothetical protein